VWQALPYLPGMAKGGARNTVGQRTAPTTL